MSSKTISLWSAIDNENLEATSGGVQYPWSAQAAGDDQVTWRVGSILVSNQPERSNRSNRRPKLGLIGQGTVRKTGACLVESGGLQTFWVVADGGRGVVCNNWLMPPPPITTEQ
jgi:hypothetical protein